MGQNNNKECNCQTEGLAILPVRYTVVPKYINCTKPGWANLPSIINIPLSNGYQYHVRSLREGFLYVYLPAEMGDNKWQIYSIDNQGRLLKQFTTQTAKSTTEENSDEYRCPNLTNTSPHYSFVTIPNPKQQKKVYIAYSEFKWSEKTLEKYQKNPSERMQEVEVETWKGSGLSKTIANQQNIKQILDFDPNFDKKLLPYDENRLIRVSKDNQNGQDGIVFGEQFSSGRQNNYQFNDKLLDLNSTCVPWCILPPQSSQYLAYSMKKYCSESVPMILAIDDSLGIALELNGYYNELYSRILQYQQERKLEFEALAYFNQGKEYVIQKEFANDYSFPNIDNHYVKKIMQLGEVPNQKNWPMTCTSNGLDALIREQLYGKAGSWTYYNQFNKYRLEARHTTLAGYNANLSIFEQAAQSEQGKNNYIFSDTNIVKLQALLVKDYQKNLDKFSETESKLLKEREEKIIKTLKKYQELVNTKPFEEQHDKLIEMVTQKYEIRANQLIGWLKKSSFYVTVYNDIDGNDWDSFADNNEKLNQLMKKKEQELQESIAFGEISESDAKDLRKINIQGLIFSNIIAKAISGLELCDVGKNFLDSMTDIKYAKPNDNDIKSMLWRMLTHHSDEILALIEKVIIEAEKQKNHTFIENEIAEKEPLLTKLPYNKIALYFKRLHDVTMTIEEINKHDPNNIIKTKILGFINIRGFGIPDKVGMSVMKQFQPIFDKLSDKLYSVGTLMFKVLALTVSGVLKGSAFCYLQLEYQFISAVLSMDKGPNLGTESVPLYHNRWNLRTKAAVEKTRLLLNEAIEKLDERISLSVKRVFPQAKVDRLFYLGFKATEGDPGISKAMANSLKSMRIAVVVAMFELYNFTSMSKSKPSLENNEWYMTLKTAAGFALAAAGVEVMAMVTATVKGTRNVAFGLGKALSGTLGGIASFFTVFYSFQRAKDEEKKGNIGLRNLLYTSALLGSLSGASSTLAAFSYHFVWCRSLLTNRAVFAILKKLGTKVAVKKIASIAALRMVLFRFAGVFGLIVIALEVVIWYFSDDDFQTWCKRCALRTDKRLMPHNKSHIYQTPQQQATAFNDVLKEMFNVSHDDKQNSEPDAMISLADALALIEQDIDQRGLLYV